MESVLAISFTVEGRVAGTEDAAIADPAHLSAGVTALQWDADDGVDRDQFATCTALLSVDFTLQIIVEAAAMGHHMRTL